MQIKCSECGQDVEICNVCHLKIHESQRAVKLEFNNGRTLWGPFHFECVGQIDLVKVIDDINKPIGTSIDDIRTRPTEPPDPPKVGDYPNPRCEAQFQNGPDTRVQCDLYLNHKGNHYHQYDKANGYSWEPNVSTKL